MGRRSAPEPLPHATGKINRKDFGLNWNAALETGGILVGEDIHIALDVQFIQA